MSQNVEQIKSEAQIKSNVVKEPKEFVFRLVGNLFILGSIFFAAFISLLLNTDVVEEKITLFSQQFYNFAAEKGLVLNDVVVLGRDKTQKEDLLQVLQVKRGDNFLKIDIHSLKSRIETLPWVKNVVIKRKFFPNVLEIAIQERNVRSIWQINEKFYPIDEDGNVINAAFEPREPILLIVGDGAPENINQLLKNIDANKKVLARVKVANFISKRRWNLVLDDIEEGITIKLPEENVEKAWKKLLKLDATSGILKRKLTIIDLRLDGKVTVKIKKTDAKAPVLLNKSKESQI